MSILTYIRGVDMLLKECKGIELEKAKPNTSEDFFNRSEVTFIDDGGNEKTFHLLYVRYFDQHISEFTPFKQDPIFTVGSREVLFKDIVGLVCLMKNPSFRNQKRFYINSEKELKAYFKDTNFDLLPEIFNALEQKKNYELKM